MWATGSAAAAAAKRRQGAHTRCLCLGLMSRMGSLSIQSSHAHLHKPSRYHAEWSVGPRKGFSLVPASFHSPREVSTFCSPADKPINFTDKPWFKEYTASIISTEKHQELQRPEAAAFRFWHDEKRFKVGAHVCAAALAHSLSWAEEAGIEPSTMPVTLLFPVRAMARLPSPNVL